MSRRIISRRRWCASIVFELSSEPGNRGIGFVRLFLVVLLLIIWFWICESLPAYVLFATLSRHAKRFHYSLCAWITALLVGTELSVCCSANFRVLLRSTVRPHAQHPPWVERLTCCEPGACSGCYAKSVRTCCAFGCSSRRFARKKLRSVPAPAPVLLLWSLVRQHQVMRRLPPAAAVALQRRLWRRPLWCPPMMPRPLTWRWMTLIWRSRRKQI